MSLKPRRAGEVGSGRPPEPGLTIARILRGSWRATPPPPAFTPEELGRSVGFLASSGAAGLAWWVLRSHGISWAVARPLRDLHRAEAARAALAEAELGSALSLLRGAGIEPLLGKGWAAARYYPAPGLRPCGDLDLYVRPEDHARGAQLASRSGLPIDLHRGCPDLADRSWPSLRARSRLWPLGQVGSVRIFGPEDHLRLVVMHFLRHGGWRPLWLCDVATQVESAGPECDWGLVLDGPRRKAEWVACALALASRLLEAEPPQAPRLAREAAAPGWVADTVLEAWSRPPVPHGVRVPLREHLRRPYSLARALRMRWPNGIEATVGVGGAFNAAPRLPFQLAESLRRTWRFLAGRGVCRSPAPQDRGMCTTPE